MWVGMVAKWFGSTPHVVVDRLEGPNTPEARAAMANVRKWLGLSDLTGAAMPMEQIVALIRSFDRMEAVFTLARLAAELANSEGGVLGDAAKSWTYDLLIQRVGSKNRLEDTVSRVLKARGHRDAIAHGRVIYTLTQMVLSHAPDNGKRPHDALLAFLMLALNDHIPRWAPHGGASETEGALAAICAESIFNHSFEDPLRLLVRLRTIFGTPPAHGSVSAAEWEQLCLKAFGCTFVEYLEMYLAPFLMFSDGWDSASAPVISMEPWLGSTAAVKYQAWFRSASVKEADAPALLVGDLFDDGLPKPSRRFLECPFIESENRLLAFSPWHVRDHVSLGTWAKLNSAAKEVLGAKDGNQRFTTAFGYLFERWCQQLALEAEQDPRFQGRVIVTQSPGTDDEVEDVVVLDGKSVALMSAKSGLVPAERLKAAQSLEDIVDWLKRFFVEQKTTSKKRGYVPGALVQLGQKVAKLRAGEYECHGIPRDVTVFPVIVTFDHLPGGSMLYKWLADTAAELGILSAPGVRHLTLLNPAEFEALFGLASRGHGICQLLDRKTQSPEHLRPTDAFLASIADDRREMRLPSVEARFTAITQDVIARLRAIGVIKEPTSS